MEAEEKFIAISALICEPARAKMLWNLLDGSAYTASELALAADISPTAASNHLAKLLEADLLKVDTQGRHRYYSFSGPEVAYVVESLANLARNNATRTEKRAAAPKGIRFCRTCYDHLAGFVGVTVVEALEQKGYLIRSATAYTVTEAGWQWFARFGITEGEFTNRRRPLTRQCLDWSERRPHLAGQLGALFFERMRQRQWFRKVQFSRELILTHQGKQELNEYLGITL